MYRISVNLIKGPRFKTRPRVNNASDIYDKKMGTITKLRP